MAEKKKIKNNKCKNDENSLRRKHTVFSSDKSERLIVIEVIIFFYVLFIP
jgi:hypothetical protein